MSETTEEVDLLGQLSVNLGDAEYMLRPSRQAITNIEKALGKGVTQIAVQCGSLALSIEELGLCVSELMRAYAVHDPKASADYKGAKPERCADLIYENGPVDVARRVAIILTGAVTGGYTASGEPKAVKVTMTEPTLTAA